MSGKRPLSDHPPCVVHDNNNWLGSMPLLLVAFMQSKYLGARAIALVVVAPAENRSGTLGHENASIQFDRCMDNG